MDHAETRSNLSDNRSECLSTSNLSSLSGLTGYEEELFDLQHLVKLHPASPLPMPTKPNGNQRQMDVYEARIAQLSEDLHNAQKSNEQYKSDLYTLERRTELAFHDKFERLMRHNAQLEAQLLVANDRVCQLTKSSKPTTKAPNFDQLSNKNFELASQVNLLQNEVGYWKKEAQKGELGNGELKLQVEEMKIDVDTKNRTVDGLKAKIIDLHVEMQVLNQGRVKLSNLLEVTTNELDSLRKSERWYKDQLHQCRAQKASVSEEISRLQNLLATKDHDLHVTQSSLTRLKSTNEDLQLVMVREKEALLKTIEKLNTSTINQTNPAPVAPTDDYELTIQSLQRELVYIRQAVDDQEASFDVLNKQNLELVARSTFLQKTLNDREMSIVNLENNRKDLNMTLELIMGRLRDSEKLVAKISKEKSELQVALDGANREKSEIEDAVTTIRDKFSKFVANHNRAKEELKEKNQMILELQIQEEDMNKKLNLMEDAQTESRRTRNLLEDERKRTGNLREQLAALKDHMVMTTNALQSKYQFDQKRFEDELLFHQKTIQNMATKTDQLKEERKKLIQDVDSYEKLTTNLKEELKNLRATTATITNQLKIKEQDFNNLVNERDTIGRKLASCQKTMDQSNKVLQSNQLLQTENSELKDQIAKFVANNFNGFNKPHKAQTCAKTIEAIKPNEETVHECKQVLEWVLQSLSQLRTHNVPKQKLQKTDGSFWNHLSKLDQMLVSISATRSMEFEERQQLKSTNGDLKGRLSKLEHLITRGLNRLEDKCQKMGAQPLTDTENSKNERKMELSQVEDQGQLMEEIKQLKIVCQAKDMENKEKQKRYEINNRTLLKKVKEHMRGRNSAEKRCDHLQMLYNDVFDERNLCKLQEAGKDCEIQNLHNLCENYQSIIDKMKQDLLRLERELSTAKAIKDLKCIKCAEHELVKAGVADLEAKLCGCENQVKQKEMVINNLQVELQHLVLNNTTLQKQNKALLERLEQVLAEVNERKTDIAKLQAALEKDRGGLEEAHEKLLDQQKLYSACLTRLENVQQSSQHTREQNKLLTEEVAVLSCKLNHINNEINSVQVQKDLAENDWNHKETHMQVFISKLQSEIQTLQNDLQSTRSDKYFLHRLCTDLKLALETYVNQSKVLKKHIQTLSTEANESRSLSEGVVELPSPSKYDDARVTQLLKQSNAPVSEEPLGDLHKCLNSLKKEMVCLRKQVTDRGGHLV